MYDACCDSETPAGSPGFVSWPYSVIQIWTPLRLNQTSSDFSKRGSEASEMQRRPSGLAQLASE